MAELKRRTYPTRPSFGDNAPSNALPFPKKANMTVAEILAFLPNSINCADVIYRMISNGGTRKSIHAIVNTHRDLDAEWSANCCGEAMYKTMQKAGYAEWTITRHDLWHNSRKALWNANRLDVGNLRTAPGGPAGTVSFRSLAENVRTMPEGDDALDLTRMVRYCVQNSEDGWRYPKDYEELLDLLGGPTKVGEANTDGAVFRRWENRKPPPPLPKPTRPPQGLELPDGWKKTRRRSSAARTRSNAERRSRTVSPGPGSLVKCRAARDSGNMDPEDAVDIVVMGDSEPDGGYGTPYVREPVSKAEYVPPPPPPPGVAGLSTVLDLAQAFQVEGAGGESDPYSAYAFGGPRRTPPYRYLNQIAQPHPWDISGWAENLRWAFEQRILFAQAFPEAIRWNESLEHMACIERERTQRVWASDELLEQMLEGD
ncbi:hypothetical protein BU25DRAFT_338381 [Macroventuria anomochaeta]|uniref:Uncharacterized protein n=1 Tax=Macroventuria anomochaeta TaxID=301207 RepID=A0ACB6S4Q5_9PLEO|nr:uncharacterized protein BU25DRAFT_338381 [Macroventuria anomochaeta]KAF2629029.1 hypothetical protein BU25DRAFT_338381 [Macroventuria anomochaeta]